MLLQFVKKCFILVDYFLLFHRILWYISVGKGYVVICLWFCHIYFFHCYDSASWRIISFLNRENLWISVISYIADIMKASKLKNSCNPNRFEFRVIVLEIREMMIEIHLHCIRFSLSDRIRFQKSGKRILKWIRLQYYQA